MGRHWRLPKCWWNAGVTADPANAILQTTAQTVARTMAQMWPAGSIAGRQIQAADVAVVYPNTGLPVWNQPYRDGDGPEDKPAYVFLAHLEPALLNRPNVGNCGSV